MKLYRLTMGITEYFAAAENEEDMYERREEVDPTFSYLPVQIEELKIDGYEITVTPLEDKPKRRK